MLTVNRYVVPSEETWDIVINGMRNPMNSWSRIDSNGSHLGEIDEDLMLRLIRLGSEHRKYLRMLPVVVNLTAPIYLWKEFDTYKVGTTSNSTSTMHRITEKEFTLDDFSHEHLLDDMSAESELLWFNEEYEYTALGALDGTIYALNHFRELYLKTKDKRYWWQLIQLLPSSYNQTRTISLNYEVLGTIYHQRKNHKLDEWKTFCEWIERLPNAYLLTEGVWN